MRPSQRELEIPTCDPCLRDPYSPWFRVSSLVILCNANEYGFSSIWEKGNPHAPKVSEYTSRPKAV